MNITLEKKDAVYIRIDEICNQVANIVYEHPDLLENVCSLLLYITESTNAITREVEVFLANMECDVLEEDLAAFKILKNEFINYYGFIQDFGFDAELRAHNSYEYQAYGLAKNTEKIKIFRGIMFEHIVSAFIKPRYYDGLYETGCNIKIDNQLVEISYGKGNAKRKVTIDIAGWKFENKCGEFYECKIRPLHFGEEHLKYLLYLYSKLEKRAELIEVGLVTADTTANAKSKIKDLNLDTMGKIKCIGIEKVAMLKSFTFPIGA